MLLCSGLASRVSKKGAKTHISIFFAEESNSSGRFQSAISKCLGGPVASSLIFI